MTIMHRPVTAAIITLNEQKYIARCLESLLWVDEILVVDGGSEDATRLICESPDAPWVSKIRFLNRAWTGFREQRNFCLSEAKHDWILVVDADEACTPELSKKIGELLDSSGGPENRAYKVRRVEFFLGKEITSGIWAPSYQDRFFHRKGVEYVNDIHEYPRFASLPSKIDEPLLHAPDFGPDRFLAKMNKYTTIEARDRVAQGMRTNPFRMFFAFFAMFLKNYFYYGAYKDGMHGFVVSLLEGVSRTVRHVKMWEAQQSDKAQEE